MKNQNRRKFIEKVSKGIALGTAASLLVPTETLAANNKENEEESMASTYALWTHGNSGKMEGSFHNGKDARSVTSRIITKMRPLHKIGVLKSNIGAGVPGDTISLPGEAAATMIPTSAGAQFTVWDRGSKSKAKNGEFWVHYTIPTPVIIQSKRVTANKLLVKNTSTEAKFYINELEVWDANIRIYQKRGLKLWGPDKMHGFTLSNPKTVLYGLCVSIKIKGERVAADSILEISGVGIDFML